MQILPMDFFVRIHRSFIINRSFVDHILLNGNYTCKLFIKGSKEPLEISRRYFFKLKKEYQTKSNGQF